jgi:hypothetical protein
MLFAGPDYQYQTVVVFKISFHIHPIQVFDAHIVSPLVFLPRRVPIKMGMHGLLPFRGQPGGGNDVHPIILYRGWRLPGEDAIPPWEPFPTIFSSSYPQELALP